MVNVVKINTGHLYYILYKRPPSRGNTLSFSEIVNSGVFISEKAMGVTVTPIAFSEINTPESTLVGKFDMKNIYRGGSLLESGFMGVRFADFI